MASKWLVLAFVLLVFPARSGARTFYVSPGGDDANSGDRQHPWASPGLATRRMAPGDTLVLLEGTYVLQEYDADILKPPSGSDERWTVIMGEVGRRVILAGRENLLTAVDLSGTHHVLLANLEITHDPAAHGEHVFFRDGIEVLGEPASHLILRHLYIHHLDEFGINFQDVEDVRIENCRVEYCGFGALGGPAGERGGWRHVVVRACTLSWSGHYYQGGDGSNCPYDRPDGLGTEPSAGPLLVEDTIVEYNRGDGLDSKTARTVIRRCVVADNSCDGVKLWADSSRVLNTLIYGRGNGDPTPTPLAPIVIDQVEQPGAYFEIVNVTVYDSVGQNYLMYVQYENPVPVTVRLRNCIFSGRGPDSPIYVHGASRLIADYCLFHLPRTQGIVIHGDRRYDCEELGSLGMGNLCGDPGFVRPAWGEAGDYRLRPDSPARDAGDPDPAWNDPDGSRNDMGAYGGPMALPTGVAREEISAEALKPHTFEIVALRPNPARKSVTLQLFLKRPGMVTGRLYDVRGRAVMGPFAWTLPSGEQTLRLDVSGLAAGIYLCELEAGGRIATGRICVLR